jgi:hypothetical protein
MESKVVEAIEKRTKCKVISLEVSGKAGKDWNWLFHHQNEFLIKDWVNFREC